MYDNHENQLTNVSGAMAKEYPSYEDVQKVRETLKNVGYEHWFHHDLWSFNWWFNLFFAIVPWFVWWKLVDKTRALEILLFGFFTGILATTADVVGADLLLWGYPNKLFEMFPPLFPADLTVIPVANMLIYQRYSKWKGFIISSIVLAAAFAFIAEPILVWMGIYKLHKWRYVFSFPTYIVMDCLGKWIVEKLKEVQRSHTSGSL